jgi:hypothetical protein
MEENTLYLAHHGVKGQQWGVRRYQNPDGSLTDAGRKKLGRLEKKSSKFLSKHAKYEKKAYKALRSEKSNALDLQKKSYKYLKKHAKYEKKIYKLKKHMNKDLKRINKQTTSNGKDRVDSVLKVKHSDSLMHYGVKGMKWKKGRKTPLIEQGMYQYKQNVDQASNYKKLKSSTKVSAKYGARKVKKAIKRGGSKAINSLSGKALEFKKRGGFRGMFRSGPRKQFDRATNKIKDNAAKRATVRTAVYNMRDDYTTKKRRRFR